MVVASEVGEEGTPHFQGIITFKRSYRFGALKKLLPTAHWEQAKAAQDFLYVLKDGSEPIVDIDNRTQGKRTDLSEVSKAITEGASMKDIAKEHFETFVKYHAGIEKARALLGDSNYGVSRHPLDTFAWSKLQDLGLKSIILWGTPGIGKTQFALAHFRSPLFVTHMDQLADFDAKTNDGIIFDDMGFAHMPRTAQIHLVDMDQPRAIHVRYRVAIIPANTPKIFTTNEDNGAIFNIEDAAIRRRIAIVNVEKAAHGTTRHLRPNAGAGEGSTASMDDALSRLPLPNQRPLQRSRSIFPPKFSPEAKRIKVSPSSSGSDDEKSDRPYSPESVSSSNSEDSDSSNDADSSSIVDLVSD